MARSFPIMATLCTAAGIAMLCGLGTWQIDRLHWKTRILADIEKEYGLDAAGIALDAQDLEQDFNLRRGTLKGRYDYAHQGLWVARIYDKIPGNDVLTPLILEDGTAVLVDRGWAPSAWDMANEEARPKNPVEVSGSLRRLSDRNPFTAINKPQAAQWYRPDPAEYAAFHHIKNMSPYVMFREDQASDGIYPLAQKDRPEISNNHLQYALFWFTMAAALGVIYVLRFLRKN